MLKKNHLMVNFATGLGVYCATQLLKADTASPLSEFCTKFDSFLFTGAHNRYIDLVIYLVVFTIAGVLPDIDQKMQLVKHRGLTHSIFIPFIIGVFGYVLKLPVVVVFAAGIFWHIFIDSFSAQGIDWFYPFGKGTIKYMSGAKVTRGHFFHIYHTGKFSEYVLLMVIIAINTVFAYQWLTAVLRGDLTL